MDDVSGNVTVTTGTYQDLLGNSASVAIYDAAVGSNGPSILALTNDTIGATTGTFSGSGESTLAQVADMVAGNTYVNIRSNVFPNGEIRGQFFSVPEPSSIVLGLLAGLGLLAAALRRCAIRLSRCGSRSQSTCRPPVVSVLPLCVGNRVPSSPHDPTAWPRDYNREMVQSPDLKCWLPIAANFSWQSFIIIQVIGWVSPRLPGSMQLNSIFGFAIGCLVCMPGIACGVWTTVEVRRGADGALLKTGDCRTGAQWTSAGLWNRNFLGIPWVNRLARFMERFTHHGRDGHVEC